jgi:hypothetical protein
MRLCKKFGVCAGRRVPYVLVFNKILSCLYRGSVIFFTNFASICDVKIKLKTSFYDVSIVCQ